MLHIPLTNFLNLGDNNLGSIHLLRLMYKHNIDG
jgi:hypothetical protein